MNESELRSGMGIDFELPPTLAALLRYAEAHGGSLACDFELTADGVTLAAGYLGDDTLARSFAVFGHDGMLGLYALWLTDGTPVVYLASDWIETAVLCQEVDEFVALLTLGRDRVGMLEDWGSRQSECEEIDEFRAWAQRELDVDSLTKTSARRLIDRSRAAHPELKTWIEQRREDRSGS
jgi:hypothetical protein